MFIEFREVNGYYIKSLQNGMERKMKVWDRFLWDFSIDRMVSRG